MWQDDTLGHAGRAGSVHDDGGIEFFRFGGDTDVLRADGDNLVKAVEFDAFLVSGLVRLMNLITNNQG